MKALREYIINFGKLRIGKHEFEFAINDDFFSQFEYSLVKKGKVNLLLTVDKQRENLMVFGFDFNGSIELECDRCLDVFEYPVHLKKQLFVKLSEAEKEGNSDDDMIFMGVEDYEIDISPYIYEFINLELPLHKTCEEAGKTCNPNMMDYLGHVNDKENKEDDIDPRWEQLKKIKDNEG